MKASNRPQDYREMEQKSAVGIPVTCERGSRVFVSKGNALSQRGLFVCTDKPFPQGTPLAITLGLGPSRVHVHATVRRVAENGMGLVFTRVDSLARTQIARWVAGGYSPASEPFQARAYKGLAMGQLQTAS